MTRHEWAQRALQRAAERVRSAPAGSRHRVLYGSAKDLGRYVRDGTLPRATAEAELMAAGTEAGKGGSEVARTVGDGLAAGLQAADDAWYPAERTELPRVVRWRGEEIALTDRRARGALVEQAQQGVDVPLCELEGEAVVRVALFAGVGARQGTPELWTWADLAQMVREPQEEPPDTREAILITAAEMVDDQRYRGAPDPACLHALILDYDDEPAWSLEQVERWWPGVQHVAHTSKSHQQVKNAGTSSERPAMPRGRVILALSRPVTPEEYRRICLWVESGRFGQVGVTELRTLNRIYWCPIARPGYEHAVCLTGAAIDVDALLSTLDGVEVEIGEALEQEAPSGDVWEALDKRNHGTDEAPEWRPVNTLRNLVTILERDHRWAGRLRIDDFRCRALVGDREATDVDHLELKLWVARVYGYEPGTERALEGMQVVSSRHRYHPVRDYLDRLTWDGQPRCGLLLRDYFRCEDPPDGLTGVYSRRWMVAAVARIYEPGCKVDEMLVLQGAQGAGKSRGLRALAGADWFSDTPIQVSNKDAYQALQGVWIYEAAELDSMRRAEATAIKAFLSSQVDKYRPPYGRSEVVQPRQCVIAGTTNETHFLHDTTGNRRSWVRQVRPGRIDVAAIERDRDQLWAEAVHLYRRGEQWHLTDDEAERQAADVKQYVHEDPWMPVVEGLMLRRGSGGITVDEVLAALEIRPGDRTKADTMRATGLLQQLGATSRRVGRAKVTTWYAP